MVFRDRRGRCVDKSLFCYREVVESIVLDVERSVSVGEGVSGVECDSFLPESSNRACSSLPVRGSGSVQEWLHDPLDDFEEIFIDEGDDGGGDGF